MRAVPSNYDQVPRKLKFEADHPDVKIFTVIGAWQAVVPRPGGEDVITRTDLRRLLDELDKRDW